MSSCILTQYSLHVLQDLSAFAMPLLESDRGDVPVSPAANHHHPTDDTDAFRPRAGSTGFKNFFRKRHKSGEKSVESELSKSYGSSSPRGSPSPSHHHRHQQQHHQGSPGCTTPTQQPGGSKMRHFIDAIRPRSKSDAASIAQNIGRPGQYHKRHPSNTDTSPPTSGNVNIPGSSNVAVISNGIVAASPSQRQQQHHRSTDLLPPNSPMSQPGHVAAASSPTPMSHLLSSSQGANTSTPSSHHPPASPHHHITPEEFVEAFRERAYSDPRPRSNMAAIAAKRAAYRKVSAV